MNLIVRLTISEVFIFLLSSYAMGASIAAGENHSLVLKENGTVWAWGNNVDGQLGDGTTEERHTPVQVAGLSDVVSISAGSAHSLALSRNGTAWAWGDNSYGQLGNGMTTSYDTPNPTPGHVIGLSGIIDVSGGGIHSLFLKSDGTVWACGSNRKGQLGDGTLTDRNTPVQVVGLSGVIVLAAGGEHSLALKSDGTVWAWGWNHVGQLGDGNGGGLEDTYSTVPVQTIGLSNVTAIAAGGVHSLALKNDGAVWAWGRNGDGQLGDGNGGIGHDTNSLVPVQSLVAGVIAIAGASRHSLAITSYGKVWFWGWITLWDLPGVVNSVIPIPVDGISGLKAIAGGDYHGLFLRTDGTVWAWGSNGAGQLGDGTTSDRAYPVQVKGFSTGGSASVPAAVMAADFDADGRADPISVQTSGAWYYWHSSSSYSREGPIGLGMSGTPCAGDVDGDGIGDMAVINNSGIWYFFISSHNYSIDGPYAFGVSGTPVLGDFDGDRKADPTIVSSSGLWTVWLSGDGYSPASALFLPSTVHSLQSIAGDFDADGKADPVVVTSSGQWYLWLSGSLYTRSGPYYFGLTGKPVAGDFDGDRKADPAMMDSSGNWNFWLSGSFYTRAGPYYLVLP